jgi:hypothetical protein
MSPQDGSCPDANTIDPDAEWRNASPEIRQAVASALVLRREKRDVRTPEGLQGYERKVRTRTDGIFTLIMEEDLREIVAAPEIRQDAAELVRNLPSRMRNEGLPTVRIRTSRGGEVCVETPYFLPKGGARRRKGQGIYPTLVLLGIHDHCTPLLASTVSRSVAMLGSLSEAQAHLEQEGIDLDVKTVRNIAYRFAARARAAQKAGHFPLGPDVQGRRVVVSFDGGRIRVRRKKRGPRTKKNRCRFHTDWREPKLLILYVVGDDGRPLHSWAPIIDGTLRGPDAVVALLISYARQVHLSAADKVLFIADGAPWIWNRLGAIITALGLRAEQVLTLIDFYHAVQHLVAAVALRCWSAKRRRRWLNKNRSLLRHGGVDRVIAALGALCKGRNAGKLRTHLMYFVDNIKNLAYAAVDKLKLPKGSGAMESAIRRVINLRIQGASIYWLEDSAEAILLLRSFYKSNRWWCLERMATSPAAVTT